MHKAFNGAILILPIYILAGRTSQAAFRYGAFISFGLAWLYFYILSVNGMEIINYRILKKNGCDICKYIKAIKIIDYNANKIYFHFFIFFNY